jgi:hypothetical protein
MKNGAFHILRYVNLYLYMDLMECEINTNTNTYTLATPSLYKMHCHIVLQHLDAEQGAGPCRNAEASSPETSQLC